MRYIRFVITILITLLSLSVCGQNQKGYVKTLGRPGTKGAALSDVIIKIKGEHNPVKSNGDGVFTIQFQNKKNGDAYALQEVRKAGYELNEPEVVGRQFAVSDKVRNTIVMVSTTQLQADKQRIENNAYKVAEKNYKQKLASLEEQKKTGAITAEKYREQLQELQNRFEKYQSLIDGLAEHYAHTDYDELNEKEQEINVCIENGNLERADSLIQLLFDPIDVLKRNKEALAKLNEQISQAKGIIDQANADMAAVLKQQEKDAEHLYQLYTIALSRFDYETASEYLNIRAELDTTNIIRLLEAIEFEKEFINDGWEIRRYKRALNISLKIYGRQSFEYAICCNRIGEEYGETTYKEAYSAIDYLETAHNILDSLYGDHHVEMARCYLGYAKMHNTLSKGLYSSDSDWERDVDYAKEYLQKAISVYNEVASTKQIDIAQCYMLLYEISGEAEYCDNALKIYMTINNGKNAGTANYYYEMGMHNYEDNNICTPSLLGYFFKNISKYDDHTAIRMEIENYKKSIPFLRKAQDIYLELYGENYPTVSDIDYIIEQIEDEIDKLGEALKYERPFEALYNIW